LPLVNALLGTVTRHNDKDERMLRKALCIGLVGLLLCHVPLSADTSGQSPSPSNTKRVVWTLVGIGAGFGAGLFLGLNAFDDAINSDRKVWTSALVGAAAGGLAGNLLSRNLGRSPNLGVKRADAPRVDVSIASAFSASPATVKEDDGLRRRVRELTSGR
jgi:hypothetical protein